MSQELIDIADTAAKLIVSSALLVIAIGLAKSMWNEKRDRTVVNHLNEKTEQVRVEAERLNAETVQLHKEVRTALGHIRTWRSDE